MKVNIMFPSKYVKGVDLNGNPVTLAMRELRKEPMRNQENKQEEKWVLYFEKAHKGLILNRTIANQVTDVVGSDESADWIGQTVTLYPTMVKAFGKDHLVVRVRKPDNGPSNPPDELQAETDELDEWLSSEPAAADDAAQG